MKINLSELSYKDKILINDTFSFPSSYLENSPIKGLDDVKAEGFIFQNEVDEIKIRMHIKGQMQLEDSNTLELVAYPFDIDFDDEIDENLKNDENVLDIMEFLWQNIVLEVPISYTENDAMNIEGKNWKIKDSEEEEKEIDPRMQKLYDYYNKGGE